MKTLDPTRAELVEFINCEFCGDYVDDFDRESAIYWFANHYHSGQWSNLYSSLSTSEYSPSRLAQGIESESELGQQIYYSLVDKFVSGK